jgi:hypothetical protein
LANGAKNFASIASSARVDGLKGQRKADKDCETVLVIEHGRCSKVLFKKFIEK